MSTYNFKEVNRTDQFKYLGRWVDKSSFRAFVYSEKEQKLANSYNEYESLITSGLWHDEKPVVTSSTLRKQKNGSDG